MKKLICFTISILTVFVVAFTASVDSVDPKLVPGNPTCEDLGYVAEFKINYAPTNGDYSVDSIGTVTISNANGIYFDWSSDFGVDGVLVKGGPNANHYEYIPESFGDTGLHSPINPKNKKPYGLSHVSFCYTPRLVVSKTATTSFTRTYEWEIDKSVTPETWNLFKGDSGTSEYTVSVTKKGYQDSDWAVSGDITIYNPYLEKAKITEVQDVINGASPEVECGVEFPYYLGSKETLTCFYSADLSSGTSTVNMAIVETEGYIAGSSAYADVTFGDPTTKVYDEINVEDTYDDKSWTFSDTGSVSYSRTFYCGDDQGSHGNTATIRETDDSDDASVMVNCYELTVKKTANPGFTRTYEWDIAKTVTPSVWDLFKNDDGTSKYTVSVNQTGYTDSDWYVGGNIVISNPAPMDALLVSVEDIISPDIAANVVCPSMIVPAEGDITCTYSASLSNADTRENTATAKLQNYDYDKNENAIESGTTEFSGSADVIFGDPTTEVNDEINVDDTNGDSWTFSDTGSVSYEETFYCNADAGTYLNTVTIRETGQSATTSVEVNCYELTVGKTADANFTLSHVWAINKTVAPNSWEMFKGDSGTSKYTVSVSKTSTEGGYAVNGTITITNPAPVIAELDSVTDLVSPDIAADVNCPSLTVPANGSITCTYSAGLPNADSRTNTAKAKLKNYSYSYELAKTQLGTTEFSGSADVVFGDPVVEGHEAINVVDSNGKSWGPVSENATWTYSETFNCSDLGENTYPNTATITETGQSASASVNVKCYGLDVDKTADTEFDRKYNWTIEKTGNETELVLEIGETADVDYQVTVSATYEDSDYSASGVINVNNNSPITAEIKSITDFIGDDSIVVDCGVTFPYYLPAGQTLTCLYSADLGSSGSATNTATAELQNYSYDKDKNATKAGTTDFSGSANVVFEDPTNEIDYCIYVVDDKYGDLGEVCANEAPKTFDYSLTIGPYEVCQEYQFVNTASFVTNDTETTGSDYWVVDIDVPCVFEGCTLTPGYWKTHSEYGPAPYDETWALLSNGADTIFFLSEQTYYEVLWTDSSNSYYQLAFHYIAAELNYLSGADFTEAQKAFDEATALFETYTPEEVAKWRGNQGERREFVRLAGILTDYNEGLIGPGHCDFEAGDYSVEEINYTEELSLVKAFSLEDSEDNEISKENVDNDKDENNEEPEKGLENDFEELEKTDSEEEEKVNEEVEEEKEEENEENEEVEEEKEEEKSRPGNGRGNRPQIR